MNAKHGKRALAAVVLAALLAAGGTWGWHWYTIARYLESTNNAYVQADVIAIRSQVQGRIDSVRVHDNQSVRAGQTLVTIDPADFRARVAQARAQLAQSRSAAEVAAEQIALQEKSVDEARADIEAASAEVHRAELELERARSLASQNYGSEQRLESARAEARVARAKLSQARAALAAQRQRRGVLRARLERAKSAVASARASADFADSQLAKTRIAAPVDGVVGDLGAREGAIAQPSLTLLRVVPVPDIYVTANYKETQIGRMSIGQPVSIHVDAFPELRFHGVVESLAPATGTEFSLLPQDNATGNFNKIVQRVPVRVRVTGPADQLARLRPGLSVVTEVDTSNFDSQLSYLDYPEPDDGKVAAR